MKKKIFASLQRLVTTSVPLPIVLMIALLSTTVGVYAASGTTDSSSAPGATNSYTIEDIYNRLNTYTVGTKSTFTEPSVAPGTGTMHTLNDIYDLLDLRAFVPKTGMTTCYDSNGNAISCTGTGQDGEYQKGITWPNPRYTDNGDGTVTDNLTQLIWLKDMACNDLGLEDLPDALTKVNALEDGDCGLTDKSDPGDWRLPNIRELFSVFHLDWYLGPIPTDSPFTASNILYNQFASQWSSTVYKTDPTKAWGIRSGDVTLEDQDQPMFVWPVRGGP